MKRIFFLLILICALAPDTAAQYYNGQVRIDSLDRSFLFQVTDARPRLHTRHFYTWFKSGHIYTTEGGYYGKLLHGYYKVVDKERRLLEEGRFKRGEKKGRWRTWHTNGRLRSLTRKRFWDGALHINTFDPEGRRTKKGYEKDNRFTGRQVELVNDSTVVVTYKKGVRQPAAKK
ncbi:hypothetical protein LL912_03660 [Niabella sp. CC-SYL272]|uniref:toxin-antitoxin system YwqK family antitoxin n=1 Tax=Niabella agricola TaxID=2891571 RepID=UPI001F164FA6|nr:hypothetical protein [Niabella agricola]MCF3107867.1 hypothetical protein [Niabella agricola]